MIFLVGILFLLIANILINAALNHSSRVPYLLSFFITSYAEIVVISQVASLLHQVNKMFFLVTLMLLAGISWWLWNLKGKPALWGPFSNGRWKLWRELPGFKAAPALYILGVGVLLLYGLGVVVILVFPQNTYDSMTYHLSRVGYWIQHGTMAHWPSPNPRQTSFPVNAEIGLMWTTLLWGSDRFTGFVQWFSAVTIMIAVYGIARLMGASKSQGGFAALLWATFPEIILQSVTTQNDLVISSFFVSMLYFVFMGVKTKKRKYLWLSGLGLGLAAGTKATFFIMLPGLGLFVLLLWIIKRKQHFVDILYWGVICCVAIALLGVFTYIQNLLVYGDLFSVPEWTSYITNPYAPSSKLTRILSNLSLYFYQFVDFTGLPHSWFDPLVEIKAGFANSVLNTFDGVFQFSQAYSFDKALRPYSIVQEDTAWFGPLSFLLLIPAVVSQAISGIRKREYIRLGLVFTGVGFYITLSYLMDWSPYRGRYFVLAVSTLSPLMAFVYQPVSKWKYPLGVISLFAVFVAGSAFSTNISRPLVGSDAVWGMDRIDIRMRNNPKMEPVLKFVNQHVPKDAVLATRLGVDHWDYVLFGPEFSRRLIQLDPHEAGMDREALLSSEAEFVLIAPRERPFLKVPDFLAWVGEVDGWTLYKVTTTSNHQPPVEIEKELLGLADEKKLLKIDESLEGVVGLTEFHAPDWDIESDGVSGIKWLGEGLNQGLQGFLWSEREIPVKIAFHLRPGPSLEGDERNLQAAFFWHGAYGPVTSSGVVVDQVTIHGPEVYEMTVQLQKGLNEFRILCLDRATIDQLPNGDMRPLLVLLTQVEITPFGIDSELFSVNKDLDADIFVSEIYLAEWSVEFSDGVPFYWLGEGSNQGFDGAIWAEKDLPVKLVFHMSPGPSREDQTRHVQVQMIRQTDADESSTLDIALEFDSDSRYSVDAILYRGLNRLHIQVLDRATIDAQPNGDTRPLLVQLWEIEIDPIDE